MRTGQYGGTQSQDNKLIAMCVFLLSFFTISPQYKNAYIANLVLAILF